MDTAWGMEEWGKFYMYATGADAKFQDVLDVMQRLRHAGLVQSGGLGQWYPTADAELAR